MLCTENILLCTETILLCTETILLCTDFFRTLFPQLFAKLFKIDHKIFQFISKSFFQFQSFFQKTELATVQGSAATFLDAMRYLLAQVLATQAFCKVTHLKASHTDMELSLVFTPASSVQPQLPTISSAAAGTPHHSSAPWPWPSYKPSHHCVDHDGSHR